MQEREELMRRFRAVRQEAKNMRSSLYHLTNKCNLRCKGCWFFEFEFDSRVRELDDLDIWRERVQEEAERGINAPLLIGGEPSMFLERVKLFMEYMPMVTVSTNGLKRIPVDGFEDVTIAISLFGGGPLDDELRAIGPNGKTFTGLFERALNNYKYDDRAGFVYAITRDGMPYMEDTVRRIRDNGNRVLFNYYADYGGLEILRSDTEAALLDMTLELRQKYPETVASHPYYLKALISGRTEWGNFGYNECPSVSNDCEDNSERIVSGAPVLPLFNAYSADMRTAAKCCTSGECGKCRDSQAVISWILVNAKRVMQVPDGLRIWTEVAESYFSQFVWSRYHPRNKKSLDSSGVA